MLLVGIYYFGCSYYKNGSSMICELLSTLDDFDTGDRTESTRNESFNEYTISLSFI